MDDIKVGGHYYLVSGGVECMGEFVPIKVVIVKNTYDELPLVIGGGLTFYTEKSNLEPFVFMEDVPKKEIEAAIGVLQITESGRERCKNLINALKQYL